MFKIRFYFLQFILFTVFLSFGASLNAATDSGLYGGGSVLFDDEVEKNINISTSRGNIRSNSQKEKAPEKNQGRVVKEVTQIDKNSVEYEKNQIDSAEKSIKSNLKKVDREKYLDKNSVFKIDQEQSIYGINLLVLQINVKRDKAGKIIGFLPENETQPVTYIDEKNNPDYYLNLDRSSYRERSYEKAELYESHKKLLRSFVKRVPREQDAIIIMYVNGSNLKNYSNREMQLEKMVYAQFVTNFLYRNKRKLIIEKRYVEEIPENEIFMIISKYEGNVPQNIYNVSKGNILQWLFKYKELEKEQVKGANSSRSNLENTLKSTTAPKNPELLLTPLERNVVKEQNNIKMNEKDLYKINTRKVTPRDVTPENTAPRRTVPYEEEVEEIN